MDTFQIVVGSEECPITDVWSIVGKCAVLQENWSDFARYLGIDNGQIKKFGRDMLLDKITYSDLIFNVLEIWVAGIGEDATLAALLHVLEDECHATKIGESLRSRFLQCKSPKQNNGLGHNIPKRPSYYIGRTLITRNIISHAIFEQNSTAIFLIKGMSRPELSKLLKDKITGDSKEQIRCTNIEPKFIILNQGNHFDKICAKTDEPVHLLQKEGDGRLRWIRSKGDITYLQGCIDNSAQDELNEEAFCQALANQRAAVCISDSPGMGKSLLLAKLGHIMGEMFPRRNISFIDLTEFISLVKLVGIENIIDSITEVLKTKFGWTLSEELDWVELDQDDEESISFELLLDGFDELDSRDHDLAFEIIKMTQTSFKSIRLWVTARPHVLGELERHLCQLGYNIRPFNLNDQINFLTTYWCQKKTLHKEKCHKFAKHCLETLKSKMNSTDQDIAGIPLQCLLIGESYVEDAVEYARLDIENNTRIAANMEIGTISNLYQSLIRKKFSKYELMEGESKFSERELMTVHARLSWALIFPEHMEELGQACGPVLENEMEQVLKVGILEFSNISQSIRFMHRTFAEHFVAWFVLDELKSMRDSRAGLPTCFIRVLDSRNRVEMRLDSFKFTYPVITYFIDSLIPDLLCLPGPSKTQPRGGNSIRETIFNSIVSRFPSILTFSENSKVQLPSADFKLRVAHSCVNANYVNMFNLLLRLDVFGDQASKIFDNKFVCLSIWNSSLELVKPMLKIFQHHQRFDYSVEVELLKTAIKRGKYSILEYLLKERDLARIVEMRTDESLDLLQVCVENSKTENEAEVEEKLNVLRLLVGINPTLLERNGGLWNEKPLLSFGVHIQLLKELIKLEANALAQDVKGNTVLHMNYSRNHLSSKDYHELVQIVGNEHLKKLVPLKGEGEDTPLMSILRWIDPTLETLLSFKISGASFNSVDANGDTVLTIAVANGRSTNKLIEFGAQINRSPLRWVAGMLGLQQKWRGRKTLHHHAAENGNSEAVELLLEDKRMDVNLKDEDDLTPMDYWMRNWHESERHLAVTLLLKSRGGKLSNCVNSEGISLLNVAVTICHFQLVQLLIDLGVDVNLKDKNGDTSLHMVARCKEASPRINNLRILDLLLQNGGNPKLLNKENKTPLTVALQCNLGVFLNDIAAPVAVNLAIKSAISNENIWDSERFLSLTQNIINSVGDVNFQDRRRNSLLHIATGKGMRDAVCFLISAGANVNLKGENGNTPLHEALCCMDQDISLQLMKILIEAGANARAKNGMKENFLYRNFNNLSPRHFHELAECLISNGFTDIFSDECGTFLQSWTMDVGTTLHGTLENLELEEKTLALLHSNGVNFNGVNYRDGNSVIFAAVAGRRSVKLIDILIRDLGASPTHLNKKKYSLLHHAAYYGTSETLEYLLDLDVLDVNGVTTDRDTPLHLTCNRYIPREVDVQKCRLLIEHGADVNILNKSGDTPLATAIKWNTGINRGRHLEFVKLLQPNS